MEKAHSRINWENYPSIATPLNEANLNKMDKALDEVDNRVLGLDTAKLDKAVANSMVKEITFDEATGIFTITSLDGTTKTVDTKLEKVATNFSYDYETQKLKLTLLDGTEQEIDMSTLISQYEFTDTSTIGFTVGNEGKITATVKDGSITEDKLQPNFLADIKVEVAKGKSYSDSSYENATTSSNASKEAKQYRDEAKQFRDEAQAMSGVEIATTEKAGLVKPDGTTIRVDEDGTIHADTGTVDYTELENKPSINGTELEGNKTLDELGIASKGKVETLETELAKTTYKVDTVIANVDLGIKETASGEEIHLTDSAEGKAVEFALYGKATQDGEPTPENPQEIEVSGESYNLLENTATSQTINGVEFVVNEDKSISINGTYTDAINIEISKHLEVDLLEDNVDYVLSGGDANAKIFMNLRDSSDRYIKTITQQSGSGFVFNKSLLLATEGCAFYNFGVFVPKESTHTNTIIYPMIRKASVKKDRYMPFGVGSVEVKSLGKNLFNELLENVVLSGDDSMGQFIKSSTNSHTIIGRVKKHTDYTVKKYSDGNRFRITLFKEYPPYTATKESKVVIMGQNELVEYTFNSLDYEYVAFTLNYNNANITTKKAQLEEGAVATEYEDYRETKSIINGEFAGIKVSSNGNYTDSNGQQWICDEVVKYADGSGALIQRIKKIVYDGVNISFTNKSSSTNNNVFYASGVTDDIKKVLRVNDIPNIISSHFNRVSQSEGYNNNIKCVFGNPQYTTAYFGFGLDSELTTLELANAWLVENPFDLYYELAEPITTPLTAEELAEISTFYPVTNISNDFDCGMMVKYNCDSKNYIDNKIALLTTAMINNI